ncbi:type II toxin-antitoxin system HicB family antitoxin [Candidatus Uhrbacteria bacterium]|nr:type II toxin-antitoxin system HicB family antitoxin [Candidatus Uhrbacteria bacterium]
MQNFPKQFKVIIERDEDGFFVASVPALPGCVTQGETIDELNENIQDAIALCLEVAAKNPQYASRIQLFSYDPVFVGLETVTINKRQSWGHDSRP